MIEKQASIKGRPETLVYSEQIAPQLEATNDLLKTWNKDAGFKLRVRKVFAFAFPIFLVIQNILTYFFVWFVTFHPTEGISLKDIQPILAVVISGTIGETVLIIQIMVKWIFSDIQYDHHPLSGSSARRNP